ncbi:hypothetical protein [Kingella potus]|nr:hypothetical protein [Kingella potus]
MENLYINGFAVIDILNNIKTISNDAENGTVTEHMIDVEDNVLLRSSLMH